MPKVHHVKKARKDNRAVKKGESYYWWKFAYSSKRYSKTYPKASQLTQSDKLSRYYEAQETVDDLNALAHPLDIVNELLEITTASEIDQERIARDFVKNLTHKHRTSQQLTIKLFSNIISEYSNTRSDLRNRAAVNWAKQVSELDNNFPYI